MSKNPLNPEEIYENRIISSKNKKNRECRSDEDHLEALKLVYYAGYKKGKSESVVAISNDDMRDYFKV